MSALESGVPKINKSSSKLIELKCSNCNESFKKYPSQVKSNVSTVFCSNQCVIDYRKIHWKNKIEMNCVECQKPFNIYKSELKKCKSAGKYCSKACQSKRSKITKCVVCNSEYKIYDCEEKRGRKYCSQKCAGKITYKKKKCFVRDSPQERFFKNISEKNHPNGCWIWDGLVNDALYGRMIILKKEIGAHRYAWELYNGEIAAGLIVCHKCDNPSCVNPDHLFLGTHKDNTFDMIEKGRGPNFKGEKHPGHKLNNKQVKEIKNKLLLGEKQADLAREYKISPMTISNIKLKKQWTHVF